MGFSGTDKPKEACGVIGVFGHPEAAKFAYLGLYALQHRGQESAGVAASDGHEVRLHKEMGLVADIFSQEVLAKLPGNLAIGHVRYSTTGSSELKNAHPFLGFSSDGSPVAVAHNGNLVNATELFSWLETQGVTCETSSDSEGIMHAIRISRAPSFAERVEEGLKRAKGAYSLVIMDNSSLVAARDPHGFRPLCLGKLKKGGYAIASESCAFDLIEAEYVRDIAPGEVLVISEQGLDSRHPFPAVRHAMCIFEFIYFSRPDSQIFGASVHTVRKELGRQLAWEAPAPGDSVVPVPDSANVASLGYAEVSRLPFEQGLIRNHYVGRTFIEPSQQIRDFGTKIKLNPVRSAIHEKRIVLVDDSIVRGTTLRKITKMLRETKAKEIHVRVSSPPHRWPCFYGIDFPTRGELVASNHSKEEVKRHLGVDSLEYISLEGLLKAVRLVGAVFCLACFDGQYPVPPPPENMKLSLEGPRRGGGR